MCRVPFPSVTLDSGWDRNMNSVARLGGVRGGACVTHIHGRKPGGVEGELHV